MRGKKTSNSVEMDLDQFPQEMEILGELDGNVAGDDWMRSYARRMTRDVDERIDVLVRKAKALSKLYIAKREERQRDIHEAQFDRLHLSVSDRREDGKGVQIRWGENRPSEERNRNGKYARTFYKEPDKETMQVSLHWLSSTATEYMRDMVKAVELSATVLRIEYRTLTTLKMQVIQRLRANAKRRDKALQKLIDYAGKELDTGPFEAL